MGLDAKPNLFLDYVRSIGEFGADHGLLEEAELSGILSQDLAGRYDVALEDGRLCCIRLSVDRAHISYDIFERRQKLKRFYLLGGHPDWRHSAYGEIRHILRTEDRTIAIAFCDVADDRGPTAKEINALVAIEIGAEPKRILSVSAMCHPESTGASKPWEFANPRRTSPKFRRISIDVIEEDNLAQVPEYLASRSELLGDGPLSIRKSLADMGIDADITVSPVSTFNQDWNTPAPSMLSYRGSSGFSLGQVDWAHRLYLTRRNIRKGSCNCETPQTDRDLFGLSFGLGFERDRFRSRYSAAINVEQVLGIVQDRGPALPSVKDQNTWMLRATCLHEIGHLLNMPHAWERHAAHQLLGPATPNDFTIMHYPFSYPFGPANRAVLEGADAAERPAIKDATARAFNNELRRRENEEQALVTPEEQRFIRHAPLNFIAQGGHTFLDHLIPAPAILGRATHYNRPLEFVVATARDKVAPLGSINAFLFGLQHATTNGQLKYQFPDLPCAIRWGGASPVPISTFDLLTGRLQLIVRVEDRRDADRVRDKVLAFPLDLSHDLRSLAASRIAAAEVASAGQPLSLDPYARMVRLPWLEWRKMQLLFPNRPFTDMTLQAVLAHDDKIYRSEPMTLSLARHSSEGSGYEVVSFDGSGKDFESFEESRFAVLPRHLAHFVCRDPQGREIKPWVEPEDPSMSDIEEVLLGDACAVSSLPNASIENCFLHLTGAKS